MAEGKQCGCTCATRSQVEVPLLRRDSIGKSHHVLTFEFDEPLQAQPGHFAMVRGLHWGEAPFLPRPMSILQGGKRPAILVKVVGDGTRRLASSEPGDLFTFHGPLGRPWAPCPPDRTPVLVAGGVGICPLLFMARSLREQGHSPTVLYGARTASEFPLEQEVAACGDVLYATEDGSRGHKGLVTSLLRAQLSGSRKPAKVYACGPKAMMAAVVETAGEFDALVDVSLETMMGCGFGVCLGCAVPKAGGGYLYACSEGPCVDGLTVAWDKW